MEAKIIAAFLLILHSIRLCYQQDIQACKIGEQVVDGKCVEVQQLCPKTHVLYNGLCHPIPINGQCSSGFDNVEGICVQRVCPVDHILWNGSCYPMATYPPSVVTTTASPIYYCPQGYILFNGMCYHNGVTMPSTCQQNICGTSRCPVTCVPEVTTTSPPVIVVVTNPSVATTTTTTTTTTTPAPPVLPPPDEIRKCPTGSVMIEGQCRLVYCPKGIQIKGRCLEPVCSDGLVWTGLTCGKPEVITTILEIENTFITELNQTGPTINEPKVINNVVYHQSPAETTEETEIPNVVTSSPSQETTTPSEKCCTVFTPRICKKYGAKWLCNNRKYRRCDESCGDQKTIYLGIPEVIEKPSLVVVPPNPPLEDCERDSCPNYGPEPIDRFDCGGCARRQRKSCSPYCYNYRCPRCSFVNQADFCARFGGLGCHSTDGCFDDLCSNVI